MPKNDYNDPELRFPRLEARIQFVDKDVFWLHVWRWDEAGGNRQPLITGKHAGSREDAHALIRKCAEEQRLLPPGPDDIDIDKLSPRLTYRTLCMTSKPTPKRDDPEQSKRFMETAKEVGADEDAEALDRAFKKVSLKKPKEKRD